MYSVARKSKRTSSSHDASSSSSSSSTTFGINFYEHVPTVELDLDTFEVYALKRLKVLRKLEQLKTFKLPRDELRVRVKQLLDEQELNNSSVDETSHFILRLSYCQTEELRRWFLSHETELLRIRLQLLSQEQLAQLVQRHLQMAPLDDARKQELRPHLVLQKSSGGSALLSAHEFEQTPFFAVPFTQALNLVARRECYLERGMAYLAAPKVEAIVLAQFRTQLSRHLSTLQTHVSLHDATLQHHAEGARVYPLLKNLSHCLVQPEDGSSNADYAGSEALTAHTVAASVAHMPLCMREMHKGLQRQGKLRHLGRLQYGLFLKSAGLDLDQALSFFQRHFTAVTGEQFQKEYAYGIRYNYGKEGRRKSRSAYTCNGILHSNAPSHAGDYHGCPYKHYDVDHLTRVLGNGLQLHDKREIVELKKQGHFGLACHRHFVAQHPKALERTDVDNIGNHPNAWFRASRAYHAAAAPTETVAATSSPEPVSSATPTVSPS